MNPNQVDMTAVQKLQKAADVAFAAWKGAGSYALKNHSGYVAALKANTAAAKAQETLRSSVQSIYEGLQNWDKYNAAYTTPPTPVDPAWYVKLGGIRDGAVQYLNLLSSVRGQIIADMAASLKLAFPASILDTFGTPEAAAAALDDKNKRGSPNPNERTPGSQDTSLPPADGEPEATDTPWGLYAAGAAAVALVLKIVRVW